MTKAPREFELFDASVIDRATNFRVHLFLGRGQYDRADAQSPAEILDLAARMKAAHPTIGAKPMFYAIEPSGHSVPVSSATLEEKAMISIKTDVAQVSMTPNAIRMRERRAKAKAALSPVESSAIEEASKPDAEVDLPASMPDSAAAEAEAANERAAIADEQDAAAEAPQMAPDDEVIANPIGTPREPAHDGDILFNSTAEAIYEAEAIRKLKGFKVTRVEGGKYRIDPAPSKAEERAKRMAAAAASREEINDMKRARKAEKAEKIAKATPKPSRVNAPAAKAERIPTGKRAEVLAAAQAGKVPSPPDFSAATHTRFRGKLAELVALVKAKDIKSLDAYTINPVSSSPKALDKYRNLAVIALKAQTAKEAA